MRPRATRNEARDAAHLLLPDVALIEAPVEVRRVDREPAARTVHRRTHDVAQLLQLRTGRQRRGSPIPRSASATGSHCRRRRRRWRSDSPRRAGIPEPRRGRRPGFDRRSSAHTSWSATTSGHAATSVEVMPARRASHGPPRPQRFQVTHAEPGVDERAELGERRVNVGGTRLLVPGGHDASNRRTCRLDAGISTRAAHSTVTLLARLRG